MFYPLKNDLSLTKCFIVTAQFENDTNRLSIWRQGQDRDAEKWTNPRPLIPKIIGDLLPWV